MIAATTDVVKQPHVHDLSRSKMLLNRFSNSWHKRAGVKKQELESFFEEGKEDFLENLLPFRDLPQYQSCSPELKSKVLSCGWLMYNAKTVQIETEIVSPVCLHIIEGNMPGLRDPASQHAVCETLVDEAYHVYLVQQASRLTRKQRRLESIVIPKFHLVEYMQRRQQGYAEAWQQRMVQFATAVVSEIFISDYLHLLSESQDIQVFNRLTVAAHRHDEMAHSPLFRSLAQFFFYGLTEAQGATFADLLPEPVIWFADRELDIWRALLQQIGFPNAEPMIRECQSFSVVDLQRLDYSGIISLAKEIGILDSAAGRDSFSRRSLVV